MAAPEGLTVGCVGESVQHLAGLYKKVETQLQLTDNLGQSLSLAWPQFPQCCPYLTQCKWCREGAAFWERSGAGFLIGPLRKEEVLQCPLEKPLCDPATACTPYAPQPLLHSE